MVRRCGWIGGASGSTRSVEVARRAARLRPGPLEDEDLDAMGFTAQQKCEIRVRVA